MALSPFERLPEELRLKIFRYAQPWYGHLTNLRLVCKTFVPTATELLFELYQIVLWLTEDGTFGEQSSFRLLKENARYAALVKDVKIVYAVDSTYSIQYGLGMRYHTTTGDMQRAKLLSTMCKALRTTEEGVPAPIKESIKSFYARFGEDVNANYGYGEPAWDDLSIEIKNRLALLPNARSIAVRNAYFRETPLFSEITRFWKEAGLHEPWNIAFAFELAGSRSFTWRFEAMLVGLRVVDDQPDVTGLAFKICPYKCLPGRDWDTPLSDVFTMRPEFFGRMKSLRVDVWPIPEHLFLDDAYSTWRPALEWVRFIQNFQSLTTLELINDSVEVSFDPDHLADFNTFRDFPNLFFASVRIPSIERVRLRGWAVYLRRLLEINQRFINLRSIDISVMALLGTSMQRNLSMWYEVAEAIGTNYGGKCALHFSGNPIMEIEAEYVDTRYSVYDVERRIIAFLAPTAQNVLTAVSRQAKRDEQLYQAYKELVTHERPKRDASSVTNSELLELRREVRTPGILARYYTLESDQPDVSSAEGSDSVQ